MKVRLEDPASAFDLALWRELLAADPTRHVFATPEWNRLWWDQFGAGQRAVFLSFHDPQPVALASLTIDSTEQGQRLRFMGGDDLTDYQGPVIAGEPHRRAVAEAMIVYLRDQLTGWDYLEAKCLPVPSGFSEWFVEAAQRLRMPFKVELHELTAVLALGDSWDGYLAGLGQKKRHELQRKMRRLDREAPGTVLRSADAGSLEADLDAFIALHRTSEGDKGEFMEPRREEFFRKVARVMHPLGTLSLDMLELDGRVIAAKYSFRYDGIFYLYNSAYDLSLKPLSPGLILVARLIERSIAEGCRRFDFLRGRERYKYDLGAEALPLHSVVIRAPRS